MSNSLSLTLFSPLYFSSPFSLHNGLSLITSLSHNGLFQCGSWVWHGGETGEVEIGVLWWQFLGIFCDEIGVVWQFAAVWQRWMRRAKDGCVRQGRSQGGSKGGSCPPRPTQKKPQSNKYQFLISISLLLILIKNPNLIFSFDRNSNLDQSNTLSLDRRAHV